tara:strand:- start:438 stop:578 length:141 start_codon:yes stop_codon:yes gene_type:complete
MDFDFLNKETPKYALVSPIPISSAMKSKMFGFGDSANAVDQKKRKV